MARAGIVDELVITTPFTVLTTFVTTGVVAVPAGDVASAVVVTTRTPLDVVVTIKTALVREMPEDVELVVAALSEAVGEVVAEVAPVATAPPMVRDVRIVWTISDEDGSVAVESVCTEATNPPAVREAASVMAVAVVPKTVVGVVVVVGTVEVASTTC